MSIVTVVLDAVKLAVGVILCYFAIYLYQKEFRSGVMEKGFRMIAISTIILAASRTFDLISSIQPNNEQAQILTTVLSIVFSLVLTYGFYLLYKIWHLEKKDRRLEENPMVTGVNKDLLNDGYNKGAISSLAKIFQEIAF